MVKQCLRSGPPAFPWHHSSSELTGPPSVDVSLFVIAASFGLLLCSSLFLLPLFVPFLGGTGTGQRGMWCHSSMTQTEHPHGHKRIIRGGGGGKSEKKVSEVSVGEVGLFD